ncbi:MAG: hypothetical protein IPL49_11425 [Saprospirales bacterium]|nr:hypothetical protein [Saprospirales bacterium]
MHLPVIEYSEPERKGFKLLRYPHLYMGAAAIFCYVGAEIAIGSFLVEYFKSEPTILLDKTAGSHVAFYWGGAMVGRFLGPSR